jgi:multiple antibiotic resistance protein
MNQAVNAFLLAFPALFSIVNPLSGALIFRTVVGGRDDTEYARLSVRVAAYSFMVMMIALWAGSYVLAFFGVTLAALRVAGGVVVALSAWALLNAPEQREQRKQLQAAPAADTHAEDIAFYPLTLPFTTGPGTISVAIALGAGRPNFSYGMASFLLGTSAAALAVAASIWVAYRFADRLSHPLGENGSHILTRVFAFLLLCVGVQILIHGITDVLRPLLPSRW